jgi:hypothetical protein
VPFRTPTKVWALRRVAEVMAGGLGERVRGVTAVRPEHVPRSPEEIRPEFYFYFTTAIAGQTRRIEGRAPVLTYLQLGAIGAGVMVLILPWCFWEAAAFRPLRDASGIYLLNDVGWIIFTFAWPPFTAQLFAIGLSILCDTRTKPVYPRWLGYFNIWVALTIVPDNMVVLFKHGAFDWRGFFPYWFPFILWGVWALVMMVMTTKAINQEASEDPLVDDGWGAVDAAAAVVTAR